MSLTNEDKAWIAERIDSLRTELFDRMDKTETPLLTEFHKLASPVGELSDRIEELSDRIEKTETALLTEFHKWASPVELRQRSHAAAMRAFDAELEAVSDRVTKLERPNPPSV
jgi:predicted nuclease with TOPRIM domain